MSIQERLAAFDAALLRAETEANRVPAQSRDARFFQVLSAELDLPTNDFSLALAVASAASHHHQRMSGAC
ncbi:hypothetical protein GC174_15075 [bacterium]|nr:hypothetical protein [bacterium]